MPKIFSSFSSLNFTQLLAALNDNLYKLLLIFFLITMQGKEASNTILSVAGTVFVIPFLLLASLSGSLADRFSKSSIIHFTRITEILTTSLGVLAFFFGSAWGGYGVLFLMAVQSAIFSPCKYGIIPEIVPESKISHCNGLIAATTYLAIIIGTFLASFLSDITHKNFVISGSVCVVFSILGFITSLGIEKTKPQSARKKMSARFISDIFRTLSRARQQRYLQTTLIFGSYFLFVGAYTQLNIIPFTLQALQLSEVQGGYLFLMTAIGIGMGSYFAGQLSGKEVELGFIPLATFGIMLCLFGLAFFSTNFFIVVLLLVCMGICGGFYIVPVDAFIQIASLDKDRGQNVAAGNFLSFVGVILASGLLALFGTWLGFTAAQGFLIIGMITFFVGILLLMLYADQVLRLLVAIWAYYFLDIKIWGKSRLRSKQPTLIIAPRSSWLDTLIIMSTLPRMIRYIVPVTLQKRKYMRIYRILRLIPIDIEHFSLRETVTLDAIGKELNSGYSVCLMHPIHYPLKTLQEWEQKIEEFLPTLAAPIILLHMSKLSVGSIRNPFLQLFSLRRQAIKISYGNIAR